MIVFISDFIMSSSSGSDTEDDVDEGRKTCRLMRAAVKEIERLVVKVSSIEAEESPAGVIDAGIIKLEILFASFLMIINLGLAVKKLVEFNLVPRCTVNLLDWENVIGEFMFQAHSFCVLADIFKAERRHLHELQITFDTISQLLKNQDDLAEEDDLEKKADKVGECSKDIGNNNGRLVDARKRKMTEPFEKKTPKVPEKKVKFVKVSPKAMDLLDKFRCTVCEREFVYLKSLKRHLKTDHNVMVVPDNLKEKKDLITCKKCMKKYPRDQMQRHLKLAPRRPTATPTALAKNWGSKTLWVQIIFVINKIRFL